MPVLEMSPRPAPTRGVGAKSFLLLVLLCAVLLGAGLYLLFSARLVSTENTINPVLVPVPSPLSTTITEVMVRDKALVKKGDILGRLDISEYLRQIPQAQVLVRGAGLLNNEQRNQLVQEAQNAEADMVNRIALARQEEKAKHDLVEKLSVEHARALFQLRSLQANSAQAKTAKELEQNKAVQLQQAKAAHELASRTRSTVEGILHAMRNERRAQGQALPTKHHISFESISDKLIAPVEGHIVGDIPMVGQMFQKNHAVFYILPLAGTKLRTITHLPEQDARELSLQTPVYMMAGNTVLRGSIEQIAHNSPQSRITINLDAHGEDFADLMQATQEKENKVIFWPASGLEEYIPKSILTVLSYL